MDYDKYSVYCDGGVNPHTNTGGTGMVFIRNNDVIHTISNSYVSTDEIKVCPTNQQMELKACLDALEGLDTLIKTKQITSPLPMSVVTFTIVSDSAYLVNCFKNRWFASWFKNGFKNASKNQIENIELWMAIFARNSETRSLYNTNEMQKKYGHLEFFKEFVDTCNTFVSYKLQFNWVKGHSSDPFNAMADKLATEGKNK